MDDTNSYLTCVTKNDKYHGDIFRWIRISKKTRKIKIVSILKFGENVFS